MPEKIRVSEELEKRILYEWLFRNGGVVIFTEKPLVGLAEGVITPIKKPFLVGRLAG